MRTQAEITEILSYLVALLEKLITDPSLSADIKDVLFNNRRYIGEGLTALEAVREAHFKRIDRQIDREPAECGRVNFLHRKLLSLFSPIKQQPAGSAKQERQQLRIAFAGETSAGKTALINTLLNTDLFFVTQEAATSRLTEIQRDPLLRVEVLDQSGLVSNRIQAKPNWFTDREYTRLKDEYQNQVRGFIAAHTGINASDAGQAHRVKVFIPSTALPVNVTLLDTPGFNACGTDSRITEQVLSNCHACIFVIDARNALKSKELGNILNIRSQVVNTFIVLNKMDLVLGDEELDSDGDGAAEETIARVRGLLEGEFGGPAALYPVSALPRERLRKEAQCYAENLKSLINDVFELVSRRHLAWLTERLVKDVLEIAPVINESVFQGVVQFEAKRRKILFQMPQPLDQFTARIKDNILSSIFYHASAYNKNFTRSLEEKRIEAEGKFLAWINIVQDKPALEKDAQLFARHYLKQALESISAIRSQGLQGIAQAINRDLAEILNEIYRDFPFKNAFQSGNIINIMISLISLEEPSEGTDLGRVLEETAYEKELNSEEVTGTPPGLAMLNSVGVLLGGAIGKYLTNSTLEYTKQKISQTFQVASTRLMEDIAGLSRADLDYSGPVSFVSQLIRAVEQQLAIYEDLIKREIAGYMEKRQETEEELAALKETATAIADSFEELSL